MRNFVLALVSVAVLAGCGGSEKKKDDTPPASKPAESKPSPSPSPSTSTSEGKTLCERLGGYPAVKAVVKDFVENFVAHDDRINAYFTHTDIPHLEQVVSEQIGEAAGCPAVKYTGRDMKTTHKGMGISNAEFDAFVEDLSKCLDKNGVKAADRDELLGKLGPMKADIVEHP